MLADHIGWSFIKNPMILTWIGRIAFPIYAFLLAEGFLIIRNDKDRLRKHFAALIVLAVVSELGFDLVDFGLGFSKYLNAQSNMFTLILGFLGFMASEWFVPQSAPGSEAARPKYIAVLFCIYGLLGFSNYMIKGNFNLVGPWMVIAFYWYIRRSKDASASGNSWPWAKRFLIILAGFACYLVIYFWVRSGFGDPARWWKEVADYAPWVAGHFLAALIISFYNGELGYHEKWFRKLYASFYPLHLYVVGIIYVLTGH